MQRSNWIKCIYMRTWSIFWPKINCFIILVPIFVIYMATSFQIFNTNKLFGMPTGKTPQIFDTYLTIETIDIVVPFPISSRVFYLDSICHSYWTRLNTCQLYQRSKDSGELVFLFYGMWRLKIGKESVGDNGAWLRSSNDHVGRQVWEFCPESGTPEELSKVEMARQSFSTDRLLRKHSSDLLMRIQVSLPLPSFNSSRCSKLNGGLRIFVK